ncbi:hypothetical protein F3Y22_tig00109937pilonHSYRG00028 [Hibiscus syriacus]|uniref:Uncharacterized protein n=1 Tax=Hibiscus syriacus TaxID=106335 RepID=A0A6A3BX67_HIBSY|nr:hypothetical protein F3Y22_tig00109937pilonHSYRG00028 [Hibiscus syriacus]
MGSHHRSHRWHMKSLRRPTCSPRTQPNTNQGGGPRFLRRRIRRHFFDRRGCERVEVGVLINNVGITYPKAMYLHEVDEEVVKGIIRVNLEAMTWVSRAVMPAMINRKRGAVVNVGSGASVVVPSHPLFIVYAATKA